MEEKGKRRKVSVCDGARDQEKEKAVISNFMQRFRPIAPKPVVGESSDDTKSCEFLGRNKRSKRKYVRARNKNVTSNHNGCDGKKTKTDLDDRSGIVTLQLLPEKDVNRKSNEDQPSEYGLFGGISSSLDRTVVESWLTVECVGSTCTDLGGYCQKLEPGLTDQGEEKVMRVLEADTCPCLVSDGSNRVYWINRAYRRMVGDPDAEVNIRVFLLVAMDLMEEITCMLELYGAVTCRVRVRYESQSEVKMTVPCDVRRMTSGGFAWRLDVDSALRLGM